MDKFWNWMKIKGYGHIDSEYKEIIYYGIHKDGSGIDGFTINHTKQMLIGYMIEYLFFHKKMIIDYGLCSGLDDLYDELREDIEMIRKDLDKREILSHGEIK